MFLLAQVVQEFTKTIASPEPSAAVTTPKDAKTPGSQIQPCSVVRDPEEDDISYRDRLFQEARAAEVRQELREARKWIRR